MTKKELGSYGESIAKKYLINKGMTFIYQNYFTRKGEIDLVFRDKTKLLFIEVKTRTKRADFENSIGIRKAKHLHESARIFLEKEDIFFEEVQFDAVFVLLDNRGDVVEIGHKPNFL